MKTTVELPDDVLDEVQHEAIRQRKRIEEILPDLVRAGLRARRESESEAGPLSRQEVNDFLTGLRAAGAEVAAHSVDPRSAVEILDHDRR